MNKEIRHYVLYVCVYARRLQNCRTLSFLIFFCRDQMKCKRFNIYVCTRPRVMVCVIAMIDVLVRVHCTPCTIGMSVRYSRTDPNGRYTYIKQNGRYTDEQWETTVSVKRKSITKRRQLQGTVSIVSTPYPRRSGD